MKWNWPEAAQKWKGALGKYKGVLLVMAVGVLKEPVIIQYSGNRKMTAAIMAIRIMVTV